MTEITFRDKDAAFYVRNRVRDALKSQGITSVVGIRGTTIIIDKKFVSLVRRFAPSNAKYDIN